MVVDPSGLMYGGGLDVEITIYRITGRQGWFTVPNWVCRECDLTVSAVLQACARLDIPHDTVTVLPWLPHLRQAWRTGAHHPPVVLIDGQVYSEEVVPEVGALTQHLRDIMGRKKPTEGSIHS